MIVAVAPLLTLVALDGWLEVEDRTGVPCVAADRVEAAVARHLGHPPFGPEAGTRARAVVRGQGEGLSARLQLHDTEGAATGSREITARSGRCRELERALTVSLVLALDRLPTTPGEPAKVSPSDAQSEPVYPSEPDGKIAETRWPPGVRRIPDGSDEKSWRAWVGAGGVADALPGFAFGPTAGGRVERNGFSIDAELRFEWGLPVHRLGYRVRSWRAVGTVLPCVRRWWKLGVCAGVRGGLLHASGSRSSRSASLDLSGRLIAELLGGAMSIYAEPAVAVVRTRLKVAGTPAWTTPRYSAGAGFFVPLP
jgi:hypothetical protein